MSWISPSRDALVEALSAIEGVQVATSLDRRVNVPALIITPTETGNFINETELIGVFEFVLDVWIVVEDKDGSTEAIEDLIAQVLTTTTGTWAFRGVGQVGLINLNGAQLPGCAVHIARADSLM